MKQKIKPFMRILIITLISFPFVFLLVSGSVWVYKYPEMQREHIRYRATVALWNKGRVELNRAKMEIQSLKSFIRWEEILSQTLSPQEQLELDAIEEALRQRIQGAFRGKGCTALTLKK